MQNLFEESHLANTRNSDRLNQPEMHKSTEDFSYLNVRSIDHMLSSLPLSLALKKTPTQNKTTKIPTAPPQKEEKQTNKCNLLMEGYTGSETV